MDSTLRDRAVRERMMSKPSIAKDLVSSKAGFSTATPTRIEADPRLPVDDKGLKVTVLRSATAGEAMVA